MMETARILIVDDEASIRFTLRTLLQRAGYIAATAANGIEALELLEQQQFDLLLLDLLMPGMSGLEVAERVRAIQPTSAILILTGSGLVEDLKLDGYEYVLKTATPQEVLDRVGELIQRHQAVIC